MVAKRTGVSPQMHRSCAGSPSAHDHDSKVPTSTPRTADCSAVRDPRKATSSTKTGGRRRGRATQGRLMWTVIMSDEAQGLRGERHVPWASSRRRPCDRVAKDGMRYTRRSVRPRCARRRVPRMITRTPTTSRRASASFTAASTRFPAMTRSSAGQGDQLARSSRCTMATPRHGGRTTNTPLAASTARRGSFDQWARPGLDYFYGFLGGERSYGAASCSA